MAKEVKRENAVLGDLVVVKFPLQNDYEMEDYTYCRSYDSWVPLDKKVSITKYHTEDYPIIGKIVEINEDNVLIEHCFEPYVGFDDIIPHSSINIKYEDLEIDRERINEYIKFNLGDEYIDTNRLCGHQYF